MVLKETGFGTHGESKEKLNNFNQKISSICIIGLGTIGGFLAKNLSELEDVKKIILIDYDTVEPENLKNSIYTKNDLGNSKTSALKKKIKYDTEVSSMTTKFIEGKTNIPKCDLVIDCRDFTYDRKDLIDLRLYISFRNLIIDCRKNVSYDFKHEGKYISRLSRTDIQIAAMNATILISNGLINELLQNESVHEISLDSILEKTKEEIERKPVDVMYDENSVEKKLINLHKNYSDLIRINQEKPLDICIGNKTDPYFKSTLPPNTLQSINDVLKNFSGIMNNLPLQFNYYVVSLNCQNNNFCVEILPETGSA